MKSLCVLLCFILCTLGISQQQLKNDLQLLQKISTQKAQDDVSDLDVDLNSSNVPTINSPEENEEYFTSEIDENSSSNETVDEDDTCLTGTCAHRMKQKMLDQYSEDEEDEDEDEDEEDEDSSDDDTTMPCDYGGEITEEQREACQDYCEDGDCECVDACYDLMEFVGDSAEGLLGYLEDYFEDIGGLADLAQGAYQDAILETLSSFYGSISDNLGIVDDGFDLDLDSTSLDTSGFEYDQDGLDMDSDTSSDDDEDDEDDDSEEDCDCDCEEKQSEGHPCACAHLVNSQKLNPLAEVVGSTIVGNVIDDDDSSELFLQKKDNSNMN